jgi:hypothetical protein
MGWLAFPLAILRAVITWIVARTAVKMERAKARIQKAEGYVATRKGIDNAVEEHLGDDPDEGCARGSCGGIGGRRGRCVSGYGCEADLADRRRLRYDVASPKPRR